MKFLAYKRKFLDGQVIRLTGGLATLEKTQGEVQVLREELEAQDIIIQEKTVVVEALIEDIKGKQAVADKQFEEANRTKKKLDEDSIIIKKEKEEADIALEEAQPAIQAAQQALTEVQAKDLNEVRALTAPPETIRDICTIAFHLKETDPKYKNDDSWSNVKNRLLNNPRLLQELQTYPINQLKADMAKNAKKGLANLQKKLGKEGNDLATFIRNSVSKSAAGLFKWSYATDQYYEIFKKVEPKKKRAAEMQAQMEKSEAALKKTQEELDILNSQLSKLNADRDVQEGELNELQETQAKMQKKLNAADKLIDGLGSEQKRWSVDMEQYKIDKVKLDGDCLTASAFLCYSGPFNFVLRKKMIFDHWKKDLIEKEIPNKEGFDLMTFLSNDVEISRWAADGLPSDELSVQNGILTT